MKRIWMAFAFFVLFLLTAQVHAQSEKMDMSNENKSMSEIGKATDQQNTSGANQLQAAQPQDTNNASNPIKTDVVASSIPNPQSLQNMTRANDIIGKTITNQNGEDTGRVHDLILDQDGTIVYAVIGYGGVAGVGDKLVPVPWKSLQTKVGPKTDRIIANIDKETLEKAPQFEEKKWPNFAESDWVNKVRDYFSGNNQKNVFKDPGDNAIGR